MFYDPIAYFACESSIYKITSNYMQCDKCSGVKNTVFSSETQQSKSIKQPVLDKIAMTSTRWLRLRSVCQLQSVPAEDELMSP